MTAADLPDRLRTSSLPIRHEAAEEIERLRAEVERLRSLVAVLGEVGR